MNNRKKKTKALDDSSSEVDDLLRAAEDHLLLNLRLNSHSKSQNPFTSSSSSLDSDLARRFDALKSPSNPNPSSTPLKKPSPSDEELSGILGDDLAARFAALKGSVGGPAPAPAPDLGLEGVSDGGKFYEESDDGDDGGDRDGDGVSKKEVEKLVQWAKDAARLDPSSKDDDDEIDDDDVSEDNDDDSDDSEEERIKEKKMKSKGKPKRFIFF